jgi:hypothetical protein
MSRIDLRANVWLDWGSLMIFVAAVRPRESAVSEPESRVPAYTEASKPTACEPLP